MSFHILVIEDDPFQQYRLAAILEPEGYRLSFASTGGEGLTFALMGNPDLIILDILLPDLDGYMVCGRIRGLPQMAEVPILMCTVLGDQHSRICGLEAGADDFVVKPYDPIELRSRIQTISRLNRYGQLREERNRFASLVELLPEGVAIVDQYGVASFANSKARQYFGVQEETAFPPFKLSSNMVTFNQIFCQGSTLESEADCQKETLEVEFQTGDSSPVIAELRVSTIDWQGGPAFLVSIHDTTSRRQAQEKIRLFNQTLEQKVQERTAELQWLNQRLSKEISERQQTEERLQYMSTHDSLTGLYNRAFLEAAMERMHQGGQHPISFIVADVDNLKYINDTYGHQQGDQCLQQIANVLRQVVRSEDIVARQGGDEFVILLPRTDAPTCAEIIARVRCRLDSSPIPHLNIPSRASMGGATAQLDDSLIETYKLADNRMYMDKRHKFQFERHPYEVD